MRSMSINRFTAAFVLGAFAALPALAQKTDTPKRAARHGEGTGAPERIQDEIQALRIRVDGLRDQVKQAVASGDESASKGLAKQAKADRERLGRIERRLGEATPVLDRMRHHASQLEKELEKAKEGDAAASARLEKELAEVHDRIATLEKARETGEGPGLRRDREHARPPSPDVMEKRADALLARAKALEESGDSERSAALRRSADAIRERAARVRSGEPLGPDPGKSPQSRTRSDRGPRPELAATELRALRTDVDAIKKELREVSESIRQFAKDRPDRPARRNREGTDGVKRVR